MGGYFILLRPPLLAEDFRYLGTSATTIQVYVPVLAAWLQKVFWVLGGYIATTGLLTSYVAQTAFRQRMPGAFSIVSVAGLTSIGAMTLVNFMLRSDFRWALFALALTWLVALALHLLHK